MFSSKVVLKRFSSSKRLYNYVQEGEELDTITGHVEMDTIAEYASVPIDLKRDNTSKPSEVWIISFEIVF